MFWRRRVDVERSARKSVYACGEWMLLHHYVTPHHAAVTRSKANEVSSSASRTIRRWVLVATTRFANYPKQLKTSSKKIRRRYLGRSENNSDTHPPASSRPPLVLSAEWNASSSPAGIASSSFVPRFLSARLLAFLFLLSPSSRPLTAGVLPGD